MTELGTEPDPDESALYVFAVCDAPDPRVFDCLPGVAEDQPLRRLRFGDLTAVVQTVRAADFTDEVWQVRMSARDELERYARAHHDVVSAAAASCPTVPLPMATLYRSEERARQALIEETGRFRTALERTAGHSEWGVKVYSAELPEPTPTTAPPVPSRVSPAPEASAVRSRPAPGAGLAYLERKRGVQAQRERRYEDSLRLAETVDAAFQSLAAAGRRLRLHAPQAEGKGHVQVLNATYLVAERRAIELEALTRRLRGATGARIDISGPWVPYSFVGEV